MSERRWYNPQVPQTLGIAQILLYINAVFLALSVVTRTDALGTGGALGFLLGVGGVAAYAYGGYGIANGQKRGYQIAVLASFLPLIRRFLLVVTTPGASVIGNLDFILLAGNILNVIFQYALIALLLHPMSREHQKVWFS
jgi:hypothetical protein